MAWIDANPVSIGEATKKPHYDGVFDNSKYLRDSVGDFTSLTIGTGLNGSAAAPIIHWTDDTDTGLYRIGANNLGLSIGGTKRYDFGTAFTAALTGNYVINQNSVNVITSINTGAIVNTLFLKEGKVGINIASNVNAALTLAGGSDICVNTVDGNDNSFLGISGGGVPTSDRGAGIVLFGNEHASAGQFVIHTGNVSSGSFRLNQNGIDVITSINPGAVANTLYLNAGKVGIGEVLPDVDSGGMCLNHGAGDGNILTFKNSDVAHGMTSIAETDTYCEFRKRVPAAGNGGVSLRGFTGGNVAVGINGYVGLVNITKSTGATAPIRLESRLKSGTSSTVISANGNLVTISNDSTVRFIFDAEGDSHQDVGTLWTNFDDYEDAIAVRDCMQVLGNKKEQFKSMIKYNAQKLHDMGVITYTPAIKASSGKDEMFLSNKGILGLYGGAIGELHGILDLALKRIGTDYESLRKEFRQNQIERRLN